MYTLGIDLGTTFTAAAVCRDGHAEIASLGSRTAAIPSVVLLRDDASVLIGEAANRRALLEPDRVAREFKRRFGDSTPIILGGTPLSPEALTARLLAAVVSEVSAREGTPPSAICLCHPANWGPFKTDLLRQAVRLADLTMPVTLTSEPEAAAVFYAREQRIGVGDVIAVYDLGGGTFDAAVLRRTGDGFEILGRPEGIERLGGIDVDAAVFSHVATSLGSALSDLDEDDAAAMTAVARLRQECTDAKEALSSDTDVTIPVILPGHSTEVRLTRAELESLVRPSLYDSIGALQRAMASAGVSAEDLHSVLLVGGSSRMPLVAQLVGAELGRPVAVDAHPKHAVALGAAWLAGGRPALLPAPAGTPTGTPTGTRAGGGATTNTAASATAPATSAPRILAAGVAAGAAGAAGAAAAASPATGSTRGSSADDAARSTRAAAATQLTAAVTAPPAGGQARPATGPAPTLIQSGPASSGSAAFRSGPATPGRGAGSSSTLLPTGNPPTGRDPERAPFPPRREPPLRRRSRGPILTAAVAAVLLVVGGVAAAVWASGRPDTSGRASANGTLPPTSTPKGGTTAPVAGATTGGSTGGAATSGGGGGTGTVHLVISQPDGTTGGSVLVEPGAHRCTRDCTLSFPLPATVTLTGQAKPGYRFTPWSGSTCSDVTPCTLKMPRLGTALQVKAGFTQGLLVSVTVQGNGTVSSSDGKIACPGTCAYTYPANTQVLLHPGDLTTFMAWTGCTDMVSGGGCGVSGVSTGTVNLVAKFSGATGTSTPTATSTP